MYAAPASTCPGAGHPQDTLYLKALCNVQLVYRQAQKLSGVRCYADFDSLPHTLRRFYVKTALEQFENFDSPAATLFQEKLAGMSRFRNVSSYRPPPPNICPEMENFSFDIFVSPPFPLF